jgi:hypothetical protein
LRQMVYLILKELAGTAEDVIMSTSIIMKDTAVGSLMSRSIPCTVEPFCNCQHIPSTIEVLATDDLHQYARRCPEMAERNTGSGLVIEIINRVPWFLLELPEPRRRGLVNNGGLDESLDTLYCGTLLQLSAHPLNH